AIAAPRDRQAGLARERAEFPNATGAETRIHRLQRSQAPRAKCLEGISLAIIGGVRPARNAARPADERQRLLNRKAELGQGDAAAVAKVAQEGLPHGAGPPGLDQ